MKDVSMLLVEDNDLDALLLTSALNKACPELHIQRANCGEDGLNVLESTKPDMVVLDISMPGLGGFDVLDRIRQDEKTTALPVIMCSNSDSPADVLKSYQKHANSYVQKPDSRAGYEALATSLRRFWFEVAELPG